MGPKANATLQGCFASSSSESSQREDTNDGNRLAGSDAVALSAAALHISAQGQPAATTAPAAAEPATAAEPVRPACALTTDNRDLLLHAYQQAKRLNLTADHFATVAARFLASSGRAAPLAVQAISAYVQNPELDDPSADRTQLLINKLLRDCPSARADIEVQEQACCCCHAPAFELKVGFTYSHQLFV